MKDLKTKIIDKSFNFEDDDGTSKSSTIFLKDLFEIPEIKQLILSGVVKSFTAEEVVNELKENETLDDAIRYFEDM